MHERSGQTESQVNIVQFTGTLNFASTCDLMCLECEGICVNNIHMYTCIVSFKFIIYYYKLYSYSMCSHQCSIFLFLPVKKLSTTVT